MVDDPAPHDAAPSALRSPPRPLEDRELLPAFDAARAGLPLREIAASLYGADRVATEWACDSPMRARTRRLVNKARTLAEQGNRELPSRTLNPAGALLRSRPAAVCRQPRCASHHQATHTGRLSTIA